MNGLASATPAVAAQLAAAKALRPLEWPGRLTQAIVDILEHEAPGNFRVAAMPDKVTEFDIGEYDGAIIVHYRGSRYAGQSSAMAAVLQRTFDIDIAVLARGVQGETGAPNVVEAIRRILQNRQVEGSSPLAPVEDGLTSQDGLIWTYTIMFRGQVPAIGGNFPHPSERRL